MAVKLKFLLTLIVVMLLLSSNIVSQTNFEGKIVFQIRDKNVINEVTYLKKGNKFRIEPKVSKGSGIMLYDSNKKIMSILIAPQKMYLEMSLDLTTNMKKDKKKKEKSYFRNTGQTKTIHGYKCEKFEFTNKGKKGEAWMTKEVGGFLFFKNPKNKDLPQDEWKRAIVAENYFPMIISEIKTKGKSNVMFEVIEIKSKNLSNSLFEPPADYKKFDMPKMMNRKQ